MSKLTKMQKISCCMVLLTILIPPLGLLCQKTTQVRDRNIILNLIIFIFLPGIGVIHAFCLIGLSCCTSFSCIFIPPLGVYLATKKCGKTFLCLFLTLLFYLPGVIYAYYASVNYGEIKDFEIQLDEANKEGSNQEIELNF